MALNPLVYSGILETALATTPITVGITTYPGFVGLSLPIFCTAIGTGIIGTTLTLQGQIATPTGTGVSTGIGITFSGTNIATNIVNKAKMLFNTTGGPALQPLATVIGTTLQSYLVSNTVLTSDADGTAHFTSFTSAINTMASAIQSATVFTGPQWAHMCTAIAYGICTEIGANGSGTLLGATGPGTGTGVVIIS